MNISEIPGTSEHLEVCQQPRMDFQELILHFLAYLL